MVELLSTSEGDERIPFAPDSEWGLFRSRHEGYLRDIKLAINDIVDNPELKEKINQWLTEEKKLVGRGYNAVNWQGLIDLTENYPKIREGFTKVCNHFREDLTRSLRGGGPGVTEADVIKEIRGKTVTGEKSRKALKLNPFYQAFFAAAEGK